MPLTELNIFQDQHSFFKIQKVRCFTSEYPYPVRTPATVKNPYN